MFFLSDNGGPTRELTSSNAPLRGEKGQVYEGGLRVPMMCQWPGQLPAGKVYEHPVISLDITATALEVAGAVQRDLDGVDLVPFIVGDHISRPHQTLFWRMGYRAALRKGDWKALRQSSGADGAWELYHLGNDIGETHDLASSNPEKLRELTNHWSKLNEEMAEPMQW